MKTINLKYELKSLYDEPLKLPDDSVLTLGKALSQVMICHAGKAVDKHTAYKYAKFFAQGETSDLLPDEVKFLTEIILQDSSYSALVDGQLLEILQA